MTWFIVGMVTGAMAGALLMLTYVVFQIVNWFNR